MATTRRRALREDAGADDYRARYLPRGELDVGYAFYRIAVAERPGA